MQKTKIEWADYSVNPLKYEVPGQSNPINLCVPISAGCKNCYAAAIVNRFKKVKYGTQAMTNAKPVLIYKEIQAMLNFKPQPPFKNGRDRAAVFPFDMTDLFGPWVPFELIDRLFAVFALRPDMDWLLLTKWPERMAEYLKVPRVAHVITASLSCNYDYYNQQLQSQNGMEWPLPNVWLGTSVEDQQRADERIPHLLNCPAAVRFLSCEPLLSSIDLSHIANMAGEQYGIRDAMIDWCITGGESGPGARPCDIENIRSIVRQCREAGVACFVKQVGSNSFMGVKGFGPTIKHSKGGNPEEWPEDIRVRELPHAAVRA